MTGLLDRSAPKARQCLEGCSANRLPCANNTPYLQAKILQFLRRSAIKNPLTTLTLSAAACTAVLMGPGLQCAAAQSITRIGNFTTSLTLLDSFTTNNGAYPYSALARTDGGQYYGTAYGGGANKYYGGVFMFDSNTSSIILKDSFDYDNGANPNAALTPVGAGKFYGTVSDGGIGYGGVFEYDSFTHKITLKGSLDFDNGAYPTAALTPAPGNLYYGTASEGGDDGWGSIFEFNGNTGSITLKASFNRSNGALPFAALTAAGGGLYYGTTYQGGDYDFGGVFMFNSSNGSLTLLDSFTGPNGANPLSALVTAGDGLYYGTSTGGGANGFGAVYEFNSHTNSITLKDSFSFDNGANPFSELIATGDGIYYGTVGYGGDNGYGGIYEFDSHTGSITLMDSFTYDNGATPYAALTSAGGRMFYGTASEGGANGFGTIFVFDATPTSPVPGPLPFMGAGAAFGWTRRLRRRSRQAQASRPFVSVGD